MNCARIYTDNQGETHFEDISVDLAESDFAPPAAPLFLSKPIATQHLLFCEAPDDWDGSWHPTPARQYAVIMSGTWRFTVSDGEAREFVAGDLFLLDDTSGKGHDTRSLGGAKASVLLIQLPD